MGPASSNARMFQALRALDGALAGARAAILAAHPELLEEPAGPRGPLRLDAAGWVGDEMLAHIAELTATITRYSLALEAGGARPRGVPGAMEGPVPCRDQEWAA